jgi:hypothetical protein
MEKTHKPVPSFDVTCVVGTVALTGNGTMSAQVAAFTLIAEHNAEGTFRFPNEDGTTCVVTVDRER